MNFTKYIVAHTLAKSKYFEKQIIFSNSSTQDLKSYVTCLLSISSILIKFSKNGPEWTHFAKIASLIKSQNRIIFENFRMNRNLQRIFFKMMYNMYRLATGSEMNCGRGTEPSMSVISYSVKVFTSINLMLMIVIRIFSFSRSC